jgi:CHAT domain-containing protein
MEEFYRAHGTGVEPARAIARAQRALLGNRTTEHPFYWAGMVVVEGRSR